MRLTLATLALLALFDAGRAVALDADTRGGPPRDDSLRLPPTDRGRNSGEIGPFTATPPGADLPRTMSEWFSDRANVLSFSGPDLSVRFAKACASLPASGGTIYLPKGMPPASGGLVCNGKPVRLTGDGPGISRIVFTSAAAGAAGISLSPGDALRPVTIDGLTLTTAVDQVNGNAAITIRYGATKSNIFKGPRITNVEIAGTGNNATYWGVGIDGYNIWGFDIHGVHVRGKDIGGVSAFPASATEAAVRLTGENGGGCSDGKITGVNALFVRHVGLVNGDCEGLRWTDNTGVAVDSGITYSGAPGAPGLFIKGNHFNSYRFGVNIQGFVQGHIHDNLFYKWANSTKPWIGVALSRLNGIGANGNMVHHNTFVNTARATPDGVTLGVSAIDVDGNFLSQNIFTLMDYVFDFGGSATSNIVKDNTAVALQKQWQKNVGLNTVSGGNTPLDTGIDSPTVAFGVGATTANVGAWFQRVFTTNNVSMPATMVDFTNAETGRQITIIAADANTTVAHNLRIHLKGQAAMKMAAGASLTLLNVGPYWQEIGRSQ